MTDSRILTFTEWVGPSRNDLSSNVTVRFQHKAFVTELDIPAALRRLKAHEKSFNLRYKRTAVNYRLISVADFGPTLTPETRELLAEFDVEVIEDLQI